MIKSLRKKFVLITMSLVTIILMAVFLGICMFYANTQRAEGYASLGRMLDRPPNDKMPNYKLGGEMPEGFAHDSIFVASVDSSGRATVFSTQRIDVDAATLQAIVERVQRSGQRQGELSSDGLLFQVKAVGGETKIAFLSLTLIYAQMRTLILASGLALAVALAVFFAASVLLSRWVLRPVEQAWQGQRRFVADASHELKTPLTVILANTGILKNHTEDTVAQQLTWVENTQAEATRMKGLVENLLFLARADDAAVEVLLTNFCLSDAVTTAALSFESVVFEANRTLELAVQPAISICGNEMQMRQLVGILLDNAIKYSERHSRILLTLHTRQGHAVLTVHNTGTPIEKEKQAHLFDRFYRADPSRSQKGYGLGLSIAKTIAEAHQARIVVDSGKEGTAFSVSFPCK